MKTRTLEEQISHAAQAGRTIAGRRNWPQCMTCFKDVDSVDLKDVSNRGCEIVAKCSHSRDPDYQGRMFEDSIKVRWQVPMRDMTKNPLDDVNVGWAIKRAMTDMTPFMPEHTFDTSARK